MTKRNAATTEELRSAPTRAATFFAERFGDRAALGRRQAIEYVRHGWGVAALASPSPLPGANRHEEAHMHHIKGAPRLTAQGHELMAELHRESAAELHKAAAEMPPGDPDALELQPAVARQEGAAAAHLFRARELRYDALGGLTAEQARRRFEPGARWSVRGWWAGAILDRDAEEVLFTEGYAEHVQYMTRENGWRLVALAPAATGVVST